MRKENKKAKKAPQQNKNNFDVLILGAGPAGIGTAAVLHELGIENFLILEKGVVGQTFLNWTKETRFITPSFTSNMFFMPDLNAVTPLTSPAFSTDSAHMTGAQYAQYLQMIADYYEMPISEHVTIASLKKEADLFSVEDQNGNTYRSKFVIAALGEWSVPNIQPFLGAEHAKHTSTIDSYKKVRGDNFTVIGAQESAFDFAYNMALRGKKVRIIDPANTLETMEHEDDPSKKISPTTYRNFLSVQNKSLISFIHDSTVTTITKKGGTYTIALSNGKTIASNTAPYLATGFKKLPDLLESHVRIKKNGDLAINAHDESKTTANLFIVGPVIHRQHVILCFIYKFRMRFAVIGCEIAKRLGKKTSLIKKVRAHYKKYNMYLQRIAACDSHCDC